jgi:hypothetical protein
MWQPMELFDLTNVIDVIKVNHFYMIDYHFYVTFDYVAIL